MIDFNSKQYDDLIRARDYNGAADYLTSLKVPATKRAYIREQVMKLRQQARATNGFYNIANQEQKNAFNFLNNVRNNGTFDRDTKGNFTNPFEKQYIGLIKDLGSFTDAKGNKQDATSISINFDPKVVRRTGWFGWDWLAKDDVYEDNAFDLFLANNGWSKDDLRKMKGVQLIEKDGMVTLNVAKGNNLDNLTRILQGLRNVDNNHSIKSKGKAIDESIESSKAEARYSIAGLDNKGQVINTTINSDVDDAYSNAPDIQDRKNYVRPTAKITYNGSITEPKNIHYGYRNTTQKDLFSMLRLMDEAEQKVKEASIDPITGKERTVATSMITTTDMGAEHTQLRNKLNRGLITKDEYNFGVKALEERYNQELSGEGLSQYQVFKKNFNDDESQSYTEVIETKDRDDIDQIIKRASTVEGAVRFNSAYSGDQYGTKLTIDTSKLKSSTDKNNIFGNIDDIFKNYASNGIIELFIPQFHNDDAERAVLQDTRTRAAVEANNMELYNYDMTIPQEGTLRHNDYDGYTLLSPNGSVRSLDRAAAEHMLNKAFIIDDVINEIQDGLLMANGDPIVDNNGKPLAMNPNAAKIAEIRGAQAVQELYPDLVNNYSNYQSQGLDVSDYAATMKQKQQEISNYILSAIGYFNK
nr:MAG TPA: hypothetical protein [Crassvirales sp.]